MTTYSSSDSDMVLGYRVDPPFGFDAVTDVPVLLTREQLSNTAFIGEFFSPTIIHRFVAETTGKWKLRTVLLESYSDDWRQLLDIPELKGHIERRSFRNPLQIGRHIPPEMQYQAFCDIASTMAFLTQGQTARFQETVRRVYLDAGVLVDALEVRTHPAWGKVASDEEAALAGAPVGTPLAALNRDERQRIAVQRSKTVSVSDLYIRQERRLKSIPKWNTEQGRNKEWIQLRIDLEKILSFLEHLHWNVGRPRDKADINDILPEDWGVLILEGARVDTRSYAFFSTWSTWLIYTNAILQRGETTKEPERIQILFPKFDWALQESFWTPNVRKWLLPMCRDGEKYGIFFHPIMSVPSAIPPDVMRLCNNLLISTIINPSGRSAVIDLLGKTPGSLSRREMDLMLRGMPFHRYVVRLRSDEPAEPVYIQQSGV